MTPFTWLILLLVLGVVFIVLELFVPSGGILSFLAGVSFLGAIAVAYWNFGPNTGTGVLGLTALTVPFFIYFALKWWPYTPIGRQILNIPPPGQADEEPADEDGLASLLGKHGVAKSALLPAGAISIEGRIYDAVSKGMVVDPGQEIIVIDTHTNHLVVRPLRPEDQQQPSDGEHPPENTKDDLFTKSLEELGIEPLDDPLS